MKYTPDFRDFINVLHFSCFSVTKSCPTLCDPMNYSSLGSSVLHCLLEFAQIHVCGVGDAVLPSHPLPSPPLPSIFPIIWGFSKKLAVHIRWPKYWRFNFSISPSSEYSGLISFRIDWLDLLAVHGTLKSLLQHHNSKTSVLWCSAFIMVQFSHLYLIMF